MESSAKIALGIAAAALLWAAGSYHVVTGSHVQGVVFERKLSYSLSETFVNTDVVLNLPMIAARAQYPMYVAKLEKAVPPEAKTVHPTGSVSDIEPGMTRGQVVILLGPPDHTDYPGAGAEILTWNSGGMVRLQDGKVVSALR